MPPGPAPGSALSLPAWRDSPGGPALWKHFFVLYEPCQIRPWGKAPRAERSRSGTRTRCRQGRPGPRRAVPYLASRLSSFLLSVPRTPHRKRQRCSRRGRSAGLEGSELPGWERRPRLCRALQGAEGPPPRAAQHWQQFRAETFFFFLPSLLPLFPSSLLPPSPFPLSLLSLPFSLSLSRIHGRRSESYSVFMYIIRQLVPSTSFASLQYLYKHITLSVACTFCYGCCHSLRDLTFIF